MFGPEAPYERGGDVSDVVFPCGQTIGGRWRHHQPLLRGSRLLHGAGHGQHPCSARMARLRIRAGIGSAL